MAVEDKKTSFDELIEEGQALYNRNEIVEAIRVYKTALVMSKKIKSSDLGALYIHLANAYYKLDDLDKYTFYYEEYLKLYPEGQASVFARLAHAYYYIDSDKSIDYHNKSLNMEINKYDSACKLFAMTKSCFYDQQDIKDESEYEALQVKNTLYKNIKQYSHDDKKQKPNKKLNIGYFSSDCYTHTMMNYILPIWENHNKENFNFIIFNGSTTEDITTIRIKKTGFKMVDISQMDDEQIAKTIYDEKIDILVELGGYTHLKSYAMFYKPAPIIILYLGYLNTLGIKEVDYILTDRFTIPEENAYLYTETPLYLDEGYQLFNGQNIPYLDESPFETNGYITFGSFNCTSKINDTTLYMWAKVLEKVPDSKLLIYRTNMSKNIIKKLTQNFERRGISIDRIIFSSKKYTPHYKAYCLADISLDTYPFSGMSIAIETALMGVPTITLLGEGMQSRGAGRINNVLGLDELIASFGDDYVQKAVDLANNKSKLQELRKNLRTKLQESSIRRNFVGFTRGLEDKYKKVWLDFTNNP